jgi:hypothetical protein
MKTFDDIAIRRPALADSYIALLKAQPGRPIALFAPRRVGKTYFLDGDLAPAAEKAGLLPVYADLWLKRASPLDAINHALEEALDDVKVPKSSASKLAKTAVKKIGALGASIELGDEPARRALPDKPELRMDALITRLASESGKQILLMLDEIQVLGQSTSGEAAVAAVRAVLQKHKKKVFAVFTGSSQEELGEMMMAAGGPMYQFAQLLTFPFLDTDYLQQLAKHYNHVHPNKSLDIAALQGLFEHIGYKPALMKDLVKEMSAEGITNVDQALARFMADDRNVPAWQGVLANLQPLEQALLVVLAHGLAPMGKDSLQALARITGKAVTLAKVRVALDRMRKAGILSKPPSVGYMIEDRLFKDFVVKAFVAKYVADGRLKSLPN